MYTYALMLGEEWLHKGSAAVLVNFKNEKTAAVSGVCTQSDARNQVAFGVAMYAGSTVISLTGIWGVNVILNKQKFRGQDQAEPSEDSSSSCFQIEEKLSIFRDAGVYTYDGTREMAFIMLLSLIPFAVVLLVQVFSGRIMILSALMVSVLSLISYVAYQIANPWIQNRSVARLKEEHFQEKFLMKLQGLTEESLYNDGRPNEEAITRHY